MGGDKIGLFAAYFPPRSPGIPRKLLAAESLLSILSRQQLGTRQSREKTQESKVTRPPTMPLTKEQMASILGACQDYPDRRNAARLRALVLLLRFSGLRIRDAVTLNRDRIREGKLFLFTAKIGTPVWCPIPPSVTEALDTIQDTKRYFFWTGESKPKSCVGDWQRSLRRLFKLAAVPDGPAHRFPSRC